MVTLAELTGATILPMFSVRSDNRTIVVIEPPIRLDPALDREARLRAAIQQFMRRLETWVRRYPGQFRNWHLVGDLRLRPAA
jgi:lauroyl/myristoyl acyltransferase